MNPILYLIALLPGIVSSIPLWPCYFFWGHKSHIDEGIFFFELKAESWLYSKLRGRWGAMTLGFVTMTMPDPPEQTVRHEKVHTRQFIVNALTGLVLGLPLLFNGSWVWFLLAGAFAPAVNYVAASVVALLMGKSIYYGNINEEAAYAIAKEEMEDGL